MLLPNWVTDYKKTELSGDLIAGVIVAVVLVPQSMAYGLLAGLPPQVALYSSVLPLLLYAIFGSSKTLAVGPVGLMSLMTGATLIELNITNIEDMVSTAHTLARSEEHTSELQSLTNLVCRLLLEKKKVLY